ncbi:MAG: type II 3-dehydroquinate dehydratase [Gammaproteobacteria bacterium]|jgi:3-dehydroquinate dehydratase-2|nr:MAG: type II 3-dehydroquinate dehydratase [Gammaproteobacteria bacterium]
MKVLVIQGAGMELRGKVDVEIFGPETLDEINARIEADANALGVAVDIRQSNDEAEVAAWIQDAAGEIDALIINPSGFTTAEGPLIDALRGVSVPVVEVHASNPSARGVRSTVTPVCKGAVCGFGYDGYRVALGGLRDA